LIEVDNINAQSNQEAADAAYMRSAAKTALLSGYIGAGAGLLGGLGQACRASVAQNYRCRQGTIRTAYPGCIDGPRIGNAGHTLFVPSTWTG
jgi:hypothetical protein